MMASVTPLGELSETHEAGALGGQMSLSSYTLGINMGGFESQRGSTKAPGCILICSGAKDFELTILVDSMAANDCYHQCYN